MSVLLKVQGLRGACVGCAAFALWRLVVAIDRDHAFQGAVATRQHAGLVVLQALLAAVAAAGFGWLAIAVRERRTREARVLALLAAGALLGVGLIFTKHGLSDYGAYES